VQMVLCVLEKIDDELAAFLPAIESQVLISLVSRQIRRLNTIVSNLRRQRGRGQTVSA